jgi:hypothetical protein
MVSKEKREFAKRKNDVVMKSTFIPPPVEVHDHSNESKCRRAAISLI